MLAGVNLPANSVGRAPLDYFATGMKDSAKVRERERGVEREGERGMHIARPALFSLSLCFDNFFFSVDRLCMQTQCSSLECCVRNFRTARKEPYGTQKKNSIQTPTRRDMVIDTNDLFHKVFTLSGYQRMRRRESERG